MTHCTDALHRQAERTPNRRCAGQGGTHADLRRISPRELCSALSLRFVFLRSSNPRGCEPSPMRPFARCNPSCESREHDVFVRARHNVRHVKKPSPRGRLRVWRRERDSLGPSMALALRAAAPCASAILPMRRTRCIRPRTALRQTRKSPFAGARPCPCDAESGIHSGHPWPSPCGRLRRAHRQSCRCVEPGAFVHTPLSARHAKAPLRGPLRVWRREWDSNPRKV